jgi:hypothetical protein
VRSVTVSRRELLELLRDELLSRIEAPGSCDNENHGSVDARELPALSRELRLVLAELDGIPSAKSDAPADEIAQRREERRLKAAGE